MSIQRQQQAMRRASAAARWAPAVAIAALAIGLAPAAAAQGTPAPQAVRAGLPNPCKTFTARSADALFRASRRARPSETPQTIKGGRDCLVLHDGRKLVVGVTRTFPGKPGPKFRCHHRSALGSGRKICLPVSSKVTIEFTQFKKHGVYVVDVVFFTPGHNGTRLYRFALTQYRHFKA